MRYKIRPVPHRNLAASKRSIVVICGSLAFMLGTTSVGSSYLLADDAPLPDPTSSAILSELDAPRTEQPLTTRRKTLGKHQPLVITQDKVQRPLEVGPAAASAFVQQITNKASTPAPTNNTQASQPTAASTPPPTTPETPTEPTTTPTEPTTTDPTPTTPTEPSGDTTPSPLMLRESEDSSQL